MGAQTSQLPSSPAPLADTATAVQQPVAEGGEKKKCKACCACPETKRVRDECIVQHGEENCKDLIEAHRQCMKEMGFTI